MRANVVIPPPEDQARLLSYAHWCRYATILVSGDDRKTKMTKAEQFFYDNAGFGYDPKTETEEEGKVKCAKALAKAEAFATEQGWSVTWEQSGEQYGWQGETFDVITKPGFKGETFDGYDAALYDEDGHFLGSIGGVTFAKNTPTGDPYKRVVEAELALEAALPEKAEVS